MAPWFFEPHEPLVEKALIGTTSFIGCWSSNWKDFANFPLHRVNVWIFISSYNLIKSTTVYFELFMFTAEITDIFYTVFIFSNLWVYYFNYRQRCVSDKRLHHSCITNTECDWFNISAMRWFLSLCMWKLHHQHVHPRW